MKKILILSICFGLFLIHSHGQSDKEIMKKYYKFTSNTELEKCNSVGKPLSITSTVITAVVTPTANIPTVSISPTTVSLMGSITPTTQLTIGSISPTSSDMQITSINSGAAINSITITSLVASGGITPTERINKGIQFQIVKALENAYVILIFYNKDPVFNLRYSGVFKPEPKPDDRQVYFLLSKKEFQENCEERIPTKGFTFGALVLPIKMRFGSGETTSTASSPPVTTHVRNFSFSAEVSAGLMVGCKFSSNENRSHSVLTGLSITSIAVDNATTKGFITSATNSAALTWSVGYLFQFDKLQLGLFTGLDFLSGEIAHNWIYRDKPWLAFGVGFSIFTAKGTNPGN